jgi:4-amino-4-deoxy-L-arabinose transferase-like glycosyltransferase
MTAPHRNILIPCALVLVGALLFIPGLGGVHLFDWDEINFAESAREMLVTGDYLRVQIDYVAFWEKPPLFFWLQAGAMKLFGVTEFAARFPNALCGIITLLVLYAIGRRLKNERFGLLWTMTYACSLLPFFYFKSGIIDPWFNLFIFLGIYYFIRFSAPANRTGNRTGGLRQVTLSATFIGLAVLTKGPVGLLIFLLTFVTYLLTQRFRLRCNWRQILLYALVLAFVGGFWYLLLFMQGGGQTIREFIDYHIRLFATPDAGHGGFLLYHFVILLLGVFPASMLALPAFRRKYIRQETDPEMRHFFRWQMITFGVVLMLFTIVSTKIVHYSSLCYFPLTFLAAWVVDRVLDHKLRVPKYVKGMLLAEAILLATVVGALPFIDTWKKPLLPLIEDEFTQGNLAATSSWTGLEPLIGIALLLAVGLFVVYLKKEQRPKAFAWLGGGALVFITAVMYIYPVQVEKYTQQAAIAFYREKAAEDNYLHPLFFTYAHYFYGRKMPADVYESENFLRFGNIRKPAYFVMRKRADRIKKFLEETPEAELLYEKNGFVFFVRYPPSPAE